ncbi:hypothetical protein Hanom_Chr03g00237721 [Helianthus anomalus]
MNNSMIRYWRARRFVNLCFPCCRQNVILIQSNIGNNHDPHMAIREPTGRFVALDMIRT